MLETEPATFLGTASDGGGVAVTPSSLHDYNVALSNLLPASYFPTAVTQGSHGNSGESGCDFPVHYGANDPLARGCVVGGQLKPGGGGKGVVVDCKGFEGPYSRKVASGNVVGTIANAWDEHECAEKCASSDFPCFGFDYRAKVDSLGRSNTCTFTALPLGNVNNGAVNTLQTVTEEDDDHIYYAATGLCTTTAVAVNYCYPGNTKKPCTAIPPVDSSATTNANYMSVRGIKVSNSKAKEQADGNYKSDCDSYVAWKAESRIWSGAAYTVRQHEKGCEIGEKLRDDGGATIEKCEAECGALYGGVGCCQCNSECHQCGCRACAYVCMGELYDCNCWAKPGANQERNHWNCFDETRTCMQDANTPAPPPPPPTLAASPEAAPAPTHTTDGQFTEWKGGDVQLTGEWAGTTPAIGRFTNAYFNYDGQKLHILNDWIYGDVSEVKSNCYNKVNVSSILHSLCFLLT